jgi:hypothetical protein
VPVTVGPRVQPAVSRWTLTVDAHVNAPCTVLTHKTMTSGVLSTSAHLIMDFSSRKNGST